YPSWDAPSSGASATRTLMPGNLSTATGERFVVYGAECGIKSDLDLSFNKYQISSLCQKTACQTFLEKFVLTVVKTDFSR
ncbi:MAG: hypothetical protein PUP92_01015, partial [Rhizonema sp. PD38]|nr:hypothetical protein [Rhizonema sp. PD38]